MGFPALGFCTFDFLRAFSAPWRVALGLPGPDTVFNLRFGDNVFAIKIGAERTGCRATKSYRVARVDKFKYG